MIGVVFMMALASDAAMRDEPTRASERLTDRLASCLDMGEASRRLDCLERAAREVVSARRAEQHEDSRTAAQRFGLQGRQVEQARHERLPQVEQITSRVAQVTELGNGLYAFAAADGSRWATMEANLFSPPRIGQALVIRRAALGSYRVVFAGLRPAQARRLR